jgi:glycosyltransferase involved in cell wall biosynthesis
MPTDELVVLSHLRWHFVWQRPQHLISRLAARRPTWFVEEPIATSVDEPVLRWEASGPVTRVWLEVPGPERHVHFGDPVAASYGDRLARLLGWRAGRIAWLYTPMALDVARAVEPSMLVYDVMDDLASFKDAPPAMRTRREALLAEAGLVFTGGRSLQRGVAPLRPDAHCFPSGVELEHFLPARSERRPRLRPVAGYVGVVDERLDLDLVAGLAAALPDWDVEIVGPVVKIDPGALPIAPNLRYRGAQPYERLPSVMAGFDVALMPFALNEATRSISPTKTLEYLAAGLPVVSTRVPDVVADYSDIVALGEGPDQFAAACREGQAGPASERDRVAWPVLRRQHWNAIAGRMDSLVGQAVAAGRLLEETA